MGRARRGRGEGGVFQRKSDGLWVGTVSLGYDAKGKRVRITVYGSTKGEALAALDLAKNGGVTKDRVTVGEFCRSWLDRMEGSIESGTHAQYEQHVRIHIEPRIGPLKLTSLDAAAAAGFVARMKRESVSAAMVKKVVVTVRSALADAVRAGIVPRDPFDGVPLPKHTIPPVTPLAPAQAKELLTAAGSNRLGAIVAVAVDSGLRQGELFALRWGDFDAKHGTLTVTKSLAELKGKLWIKEVKTKNARRLVVLDFSIPSLLAHREKMTAEGRGGDTDLIFGDTEGSFLRKSNFLRRTWKPIKAAAKLPKLKFHELRHSSASLLLLAGVDAKTVSSRLGHGSAGFTMNTYQHVIAGMQKKAAGALADVLNSEIGYSQATEAPESGSESDTKKPRKV